jgi:hypothetical protein
MRLRSPLAIAALVLVTTATSCEDGTGPALADGAYTLRTIGGQALPVLVREERLPYSGTGVMGTRREYVDAMRLALVAADVDTFSVLGRVTWDLDQGDDPGTGVLAASQTFDAAQGLRCFALVFGTGTSVPPDVEQCGPASPITGRGDRLTVELIPGPYPTIGKAAYVFVREGR